MIKQLRPALVIVVLLTLLTGLAYPFAITGVAGVLFPRQAEGSLVTVDGKVVGSSLIAQGFSSDKYFHPRPSATTITDPKDPSKTIPKPYAADSSGGSNLGPTNKALIDRIKADTDKLKAENPGMPVPQDLVTTSGSGLDPDISPDGALFQVPRIAKARKISEEKLRDLIASHTEGTTLGLFGEPKVNVLMLNLALDALPQS